MASGLIALALITDVLDGIIARRWGVSSIQIRKLDSNVDQVFWIGVIAAIFILRLDLVKSFAGWIFLVVMLEVLAYVISGIKFSKTVATHTLLAKLWTLTLLTLLIELLLFQSNKTMVLCLALGVISRLEIIGILLVLRSWVSDVPGIISAFKIRRGKPIKRSKWFNG